MWTHLLEIPSRELPRVTSMTTSTELDHDVFEHASQILTHTRHTHMRI